MGRGISAGRVLTVGGVLALATLILAGRIAYLQVVEHERYVAMADDEHWGTRQLEPHRGAIRDRNGQPLAVSISTYRIWADPSKIAPEQTSRIANLLAPVLNVPTEKLLTTLTTAPRDQKVLLAEGLPYETGPKIESLGIQGIITDRQIARLHPEGNIAAQLLGIVGKDQVGLSGVEMDYNRQLVGATGAVTYERDTTGAEIPLGMHTTVKAEDGSDVVLTIDRFVQRIADQEADKAMIEHKADGVTIMVMDPRSGEILAMTSRPSFDITRPITATNAIDLIRNRPVTDMYEPGSIFKIITMAAALQEGLVTPNTTYMDNGWVTKYNQTIVNWDGGANGLTTMTNLLVKSANVGAVWVSDRLGVDRFYKFVHLFGFGQPTNIDLNGEASGQVRVPDDTGWSPFDLATNSFGQGLNVTPVQLITAVSAIANGGNLMQPHVVKQIVGPNGTRTYDPVVVRRVISEETSKTLREMMVHVVDEGTQKAVIPGYRLSGKSGTTQVVLNKTYSDDQTIASFAVFPTDNAPFVVLVRVDRPKDIQWGGQVAAPIAKTIVERLLAYYRIPPSDAKPGV